MIKGDKVRLNHELLIWVGFTLSNGVWSYPDGVTVDNGVPYFPEDINACVKHLFPKLLFDNRLWGHFVEFARYKGLSPNRRRLKDGEMIKRLFDPLYICQTIEKVIDL